MEPATIHRAMLRCIGRRWSLAMPSRKPWAVALLVALAACERCGGAEPPDKTPQPGLEHDEMESGDGPLESGDDQPSDPSRAHGWTQAHLEALVRYAESCTTLSKQLIDLRNANDLLRAPQ